MCLASYRDMITVSNNCRFALVLGFVVCLALAVTGSVRAEFDPATYDSDGDCVIQREEVIAAIADYFGGEIDRDDVISIIVLYFKGEPVLRTRACVWPQCRGSRCAGDTGLAWIPCP